MAMFSSSRQAFKPHVHVAEERCPVCEQLIPNEKAKQVRSRIEGWEGERRAAMLEEFARDKAEGEARARSEARSEARAEAQAAAEAAMTLRLAEFQSRLAQEQQARADAAGQIAALKAEQQAAVEKRVNEAQESLLRQKEDLQREKEAAVLAEKAKVLKLTSELADLQRKLEGKSAHELGEGSEIDLYEQLRATFASDRIQRVPKGVNGADVIHEVMHNGRACGKIVYDAKNRDAWQNGFATKLKADKLAQGADHAILSSNKFPKDKSEVHPQDGVIIANPRRVLALAEILRDQLIRMHELRVSNQERGSKTVGSTPSSPRSTAGSWSARSKRRPARCSTSTPGAGGAPAPVGRAQEADPLGAEGAQRLGVRDRPHHRHRRQRPGGAGRLGARPARALSS
jgi:hypothetical protein